MEPQRGGGEQQGRAQGGGQRGGQEPAVIHQPEGDDLHLEAVLCGHAAEDAFLERSVNNGPQDTEVPREDAGVFLHAVILLPAVHGVEGAHGAREEDGGVGRNQHLFRGRSAQLQSWKERN